MTTYEERFISDLVEAIKDGETADEFFENYLHPIDVSLSDFADMIKEAECRIKEEEGKKYYWRKKQEYSASFEGQVWLRFNSFKGNALDLGEREMVITYLTISQAKELLGDDFDKFEKVEIEE